MSDMQPIVEIHGTGTHNRGAELMAIAIIEKLRSKYANPIIVVEEKFGTIGDLEKYELQTTWETPSKFHRNAHRIARRIRSNLPPVGTTRIERHLLKLSRQFSEKRSRFVDPERIDIVIDASGFAFSDQWGAGPAKYLVDKMNWQRAGKPLLLLPQAFGPFSCSGTADAARKLVQRSDFCLVRDFISLQEVRQLVPDAENVFLFPDFTPPVAPLSLQEGKQLQEDFVAIVPNFRMLDKTDEPAQYLDFLCKVCSTLQQSGLDGVFILHDAKEDGKILDLLGPNVAKMDVFTHSDPRVLKYVLGKAKFVVGSRFHALVSSFSQGVPCIVAGWSHKYPELVKQFNCDELLLSDINDQQELDRLLESLISEETNEKFRQRIQIAADQTKQKIDEMWEMVFRAVDSLRSNRS